MGKDGTSVGIDLGTTYSVIARVTSAGYPEVVPNSEGQLTTPSVVFIEDDVVMVGAEAAKAALLQPERSADCFKRDMGAPYYSRKVCGKQMRPEALSAFVLKKLKQNAEPKIGAIGGAVITVPAYFNDLRRNATFEAGRLAGLAVVGIINEPTAAAMAYGYERYEDDTEKIILVYDLGGGTFDATLMRVSGQGKFETIATDGDVMLGGKDWNDRVLDYVANQFAQKAGGDPRDDPISFQDLASRVEDAKRTLSMRKFVSIPVTHAGQRLAIRLDRDKFMGLSSDLITRTQTTIELLAEEAGVALDEIDDILLAGGSTRMPMVAEMLENLFGRRPTQLIDQDLAVAKGAAIYAAHLRVQEEDAAEVYLGEAAEQLGEMQCRDVNSHSLGVAAQTRDGGNKNIVLIPRNTPIPAQRSRTFALARTGAQTIRVIILEGEAPTVSGCVKIGVCEIANLPSDLPIGTPVDVTFSYSENGCIFVHAEARGIGKSTSVEITRANALERQDEENTTLGSSLEVL